MSMTDPISDMLTRIRNAQTARTDDAGRALLEAFKFPLRGDR